MTADTDEDLVNDALISIEEDGKTVTVTTAPTDGVYNPETRKVEGATPGSTGDRKAIVKDFDGKISNATNLSIETGDKQFIFAASGMTKPVIGSTIIVDGEVFSIVPEKNGGLETQVVYAGELAALYKVHGRHS